MTNFRLFQTKRVCRRHFKFDENGGKSCKRREKTVGKGEIACYKQFLHFFLSVFKKTCTADMLKPGLVWERVNGW